MEAPPSAPPAVPPAQSDKEPYLVPEQSKRKIYYASRKELELAIRDKFSSQKSAQVNDAEQEILKKEKKQ